MNILWIEDSSEFLAGKSKLNSIFGELLSFDAWDNDLFNLTTEPSGLSEFCKQQKSLNIIYLCRNWFDYEEFKKINDVVNKIDLFIIDVRLDNGEHVDLNNDIPTPYTDKSKFHQHAGFYIFNGLIRLGVPVERMCFTTGEKITLDDFKSKCSEIYMPEPTAFEKRDDDLKKLKQWIRTQDSAYSRLRRGIIEGCRLAKSLNKDRIYFHNFIPLEQDYIKQEYINNYLSILEDFFPLREPKELKSTYKLFIRTLSHEWEAAKTIKYNEEKPDAVLGWVMRNTRHWITHNSRLFKNVDEQLVAYLFIINLRTIYKLDDDIYNYENILFSIFDEESLQEKLFKPENIPIGDIYIDLRNLIYNKNKDIRDNKHKIKEAFYFPEMANNIQESKSYLKNDEELFFRLLYQMFWLTICNPYVDKKGNSRSLEIKFSNFKPASPYMLKLARCIYTRSGFPKVAP